MRRPALLAALALIGVVAAPALAHEGNPNFESIVTRVDGVTGVRAQILNGDDALLIVSSNPKTLVVEGYDEEPYARLRADGIVEVNRRSSATYLNEERFANVKLPASVDPKAAPQWKTIGPSRRFEFHDHRMHWMAKGTPPQVKDESKRQKVFDWSIPVRAGATQGTIRGTLWWRGTGDDAPVGAYIAGGALLVLSAVFVVVVRRRRRPAAREAW